MGVPAQQGIADRRIPTWLILVLAAVVGLGTLALLVGLAGTAGVLFTALTDGPVALAMFISAGGWGNLAVRRLLPRDCPPGLAAATSVAAGLWLLGTAVLVVGWALHGALTAWVWWPVVGVGLVLAAVLSRKQIPRVRLSSRVGWWSLLCLPAAAALAMWLAGATMPPGLIGRATGDFYDVVSYHLQVPREFYEAQQIHFLPHNSYSNYPLGGEMLFLLGMCLRGGAYAGVYAAKFTHGLWGILAAVALIYGPVRDRLRGKAATVLLATSPWVIYLSWLAFVELGELAYLAAGIAWIEMWVRRRDVRSAAMVGLAAGGACAIKYLCMGLVVMPLAAAMVGVTIWAALSRKRRENAVGKPVVQENREQKAFPGNNPPPGNPVMTDFKGLLVTGFAAILLFSPWLIRNVINTGNPVFPLATSLLGRGPWSELSVARWDAGHAALPWPEKLDRLGDLVGHVEGLGALPVVFTLAAIALAAARWRRTESLEWICIIILVVQVAIWMFATHMPLRFLVPAVVPMSLLIGGLASRIRGGADDPEGPVAAATWYGARRVRAAAGIVMVLVVCGANLGRGLTLFHREPFVHSAEMPALNGLYPDEVEKVAGNEALSRYLRPGSRLLMIGDVRPFNFPSNTLYATVWDPDPLVQIVRRTRDSREIIRRLQEMGVTHIWIHWGEIDRVRKTYGWWDEINEPLIEGLVAAGAQDVDVLNEGPPAAGHRPLVEMLILPRAQAGTKPRTRSVAD